MTRSARPADLLDLVSLRSLPLHPLGGPWADTDGAVAPGPLPLLVALTAGFGQHRLIVASEKRRLEGAVHLICRPRAHRWEVARAAPVQGRHDWLADVLDVASVVAAAQGIPRVMARVARDDARLPAFEEAGFRPYSCETIFGAELGDPAEPSDAFTLRAVQRADELALQHLLGMGTPPTVQATDSWEPREVFAPFIHGPNVLVEENGEVLAAAGAILGRRCQVANLRLIVRPNHAAAGEVALTALLSQLGRRGVKQAWLVVRDYLADGLTAARLAGLTAVGAQDVLVKHTAALVRQAAFSTRLRDVPAAIPAVHGSHLVHGGAHVRQCRLRGEARPRRRAVPTCAA